MKRFFTLLITFSIVLSLAACGGSTTEPSDTAEPPTETEQLPEESPDRQESPAVEPAETETPAPVETSKPAPAPVETTPAAETSTPQPAEPAAPKKDTAAFAAKAEPAAPKQETPKQETTKANSRTVYVTKSGKRYHYDNSCNGGTYFESTMDEALARGLTPCQKCVG